MPTPIAQLLRDEIQVLRASNPGIVCLEQDCTQVGDAVLLLVFCQHRLAVGVVVVVLVSIAGGWRQHHDSIRALEQVFDVLGGHLGLG